MLAAAAKFINNMEGAVHDIDVPIITPTPTAPPPPQSKPRKLTESNTDPQAVITNFNGNAKPDTVEWLSPAPQQHPIAAAAPSPDDDVNGSRCCQRRVKECRCSGELWRY